MKQRTTIKALLISIVTLWLVGCSTSVSYKPPLLPVKLIIDNAGNVSVVGEVSIVTFVGEFSIGAEYTINSEPDSILVIIRDQNRSSHGLDTIYRVRSNGDELAVVLNGKTTVHVVNNRVLIDITNADVKSIEFKCAEDSGVKTSGFWGIKEDSYRPFKVMQRLIDKDTWFTRIAAFLLFPVELIAFPLFFILRVSYILFGDIGAYGAYFVFTMYMVISWIIASESDVNAVLATFTRAVFICHIIIALML